MDFYIYISQNKKTLFLTLHYADASWIQTYYLIISLWTVFILFFILERLFQLFVRL